MAQAALLPDPTQVELVTLVGTTTGITAVVRARGSSTRCPVCGAQSERVHSRYTRQVADLPWCGVAVRLHLQVRRFFCDQPMCLRTIFTERLPGVVAPYARRTVRLSQLVELVGFLLGGSAGSRLLRHLAPGALLGSRDTMLRTIRRATCAGPQTLDVLSVDDFALRRGVTYGTLLVDLERCRVVDLLPERSDVAFARWVRQHPEVLSMFMIIFQFHVQRNLPVAPPLPSRLSGLEKWKRERRVHAAAAVDGNSARAW